MSRRVPLALGLAALLSIAGEAFAGKKAPLLPVTGRTVAGPVAVHIADGASSAPLSLPPTPICMTVVNTGKGVVTVFTLMDLGPGDSAAVCTGSGFFPGLVCDAGGRKSGCSATWRLDRYFGL